MEATQSSPEPGDSSVRPEIRLFHLAEAVIGVVQPLTAAPGDCDDVLDTHSEASGEVDTRLNREAHPRPEHLLLTLDQVRRLVRRHADAVAGAVDELGTVSDMLWARPAITVLGIDCPPVTGSTAAIVPRAAARLNLRIPPGIPTGDAHAALVDHLRAVTPWGIHVEVETEATGSPFQAATGGAAYRAMDSAMLEAYGVPMTTLGQGGSIPLCNVLAETYPHAELILMGVEEPLALIHAPNESVDPAEIQAMALTVALFLQRYATLRS